MNNQYYVYAWKDIDTGYVFYVGMGQKDRINRVGYYCRNKYFMEYYNTHNCIAYYIDVGLSKGESEQIETENIVYYHSINQCYCNSTWNGKNTGVYGERNGNYNNGDKLHKTYQNHPELKDKTKHIGIDNGRARKIIAIYKDTEYVFDMVKDAAQWMIDNKLSKSTVLHIMSAIALRIKQNKPYCNVIFKYID